MPSANFISPFRSMMVMMPRRGWRMRRDRSSTCTARVTAGRCTPSMMERNLCVRGSSAAVDAVVRHQQPAGQALFVLAAAIGQRRLRRLDERSVRACAESGRCSASASRSWRGASLAGADALPGTRAAWMYV